MENQFTRRQLETNPIYARSFISWLECENGEDYSEFLDSDESACNAAVYLWDQLRLELQRLRGMLH